MKVEFEAAGADAEERALFPQRDGRAPQLRARADTAGVGGAFAEVARRRCRTLTAAVCARSAQPKVVANLPTTAANGAIRRRAARR